MDHYYAGYIKNADPSLREEYKIRRDNFNKKYKHKRWAYLDLRENIKMSLKWMVGFFVIITLAGLIRKYNTNKDLYVMIYMVQMVLGTGFLINTIIWLSRSLKSYWDKDFL